MATMWQRECLKGMLILSVSFNIKSIDEMERLAGTGHSSINPLVGAFYRLPHKVVGEVDKGFLPFSTLCLVAGDHVAVIATECVQVGVNPHCFVELFPVFLRDVSLLHSGDKVNKQLLLLCLAEIGHRRAYRILKQ